MEANAKSEPVGEAEVVPGSYGANLDENTVLGTSEMISAVEASGTFTGKIEGEIKEVCTKKKVAGLPWTLLMANPCG